MTFATHLDNGRFIDRRALDKRPPSSRLVVSSLSAGWTSVFAALYESDGASERFEKPETPDYTLFVTLSGQYELEAYPGGLQRKVLRRPGTIGITPPGESVPLQWRAVGGRFASLHLHIPYRIVRDASAEYRSAGLRNKTRIGSGRAPLDHMSLVDPVVAHVAKSILRAAASGAPELYAESAAHFVIRHLLEFQTDWSITPSRGAPPDRRLSAVIEYMHANYMKPLGLDELAREAGVGQHHFGQLFKRAVGETPHHYLVGLRMRAAASMLTETDKSVSAVAAACGFYRVAHFSDAFRRHFSRTPTQYRQTREATTGQH